MIEDNGNWGMLAGMQDQERQSVPPVRWICPYCGHEVPDDHSVCCKEMGHAEPMDDEDTDEA